ncbi:hypothetical protein [Kitasatospora mediocidica]|uniref:hypothetical protein n=1 Tax=Kitasatospora mediocidica TaxID=58352 RepID=UPI00055FF8AB|nr:hypothetical protein [Kitasatospora mediocidica]
MTDDKNRPVPDAGDDGPVETPLEQLLREALAARAGRLSAHDLRTDAPPARRMRRTRPLYTVALPLLGLAAAASIGYVGFHAAPMAKQTPPPAASISVSPQPSPTLSPVVASSPPSPSASGMVTAGGPAAGGQQSPDGASSSSAATGTPYTFKNVTFTVPAGWAVTVEGLNDLCVAAQAAPVNQERVCQPYGVDVTVYGSATEAVQGVGPGDGSLDASDGYAHQPYCYSSDNPHEKDASGNSDIQTLTAESHTVVTVAHHKASLATWHVGCSSGESFTARMWGFRSQQVFVAVDGLKAGYEAGLQSILGSLDLSGKSAVEPVTGLPGEGPELDSYDQNCQVTQGQTTDPTYRVESDVLAAAKAKDYTKLTALYQVNPSHTAQGLAAQQTLWHQAGVLDQLIAVLTETHQAGTDGITRPAFTMDPSTKCPQAQADLSVFGLTKASDYHGVTSYVYAGPDSATGPSVYWNGIVMT